MGRGFYLLGRGIQLLGLIITFHAVVLFFIPSMKMGPLLGLSLVGILTFYIGYFIAGSSLR